MTIFPFEVSWNICPEQPACIEKPKTVYLGEEKIDFFLIQRICIRAYFESHGSPSRWAKGSTLCTSASTKEKHHCPGPESTRKFVSPGVKLRVPIRRRWVSVREWRLSYKMILLEVNQYGGLMKTTLLASFERSMALFRQDSPQGTDAREGIRSLPLVFIGRSCYKLSWSGLETSPVP